jgi:thiamine pyrophosphokinase
MQCSFRSNKAKYPELIVGDFDSITAESKKFFGKRNSTELIHVADQNSTDLTKTLNALMEKVSAVFKSIKVERDALVPNNIVFSEDSKRGHPLAGRIYWPI